MEQLVIDALKAGFGSARKFNEQALGIELSEFKHGGIGIEYVATVKAAEKLFSFDKVVIVEKQYKHLRKAICCSLAFNTKMKNLGASNREKRNAELKRLREVADEYTFGDGDLQRVDIAVLDKDGRMPQAIVEIKIHNGSYGRYKKDVQRIAKIVQMYSDFVDGQHHDFIGFAAIYTEKAGASFAPNSTSPNSFRDEVETIKKDVAKQYPLLAIEIVQICCDKEPIKTETFEEEEVLTRDEMGFLALAIVVSAPPPTSASSGSPAEQAVAHKG